MRKTLTCLFALILALSFCLPAAAATPWLTDLEAAKVQAKKEHKDILMFFSGSDWCHWCKKLDEEVFSHEDFLKKVQQNFVLVNFDFPKNKKQDEKLRKTNQQMAKKFKIKGYPTVLLADAGGQVYARTGYQQGGVEAYLKHLQQLRAGKQKLDEVLKKAEKAQGLEKARLLDQALTIMSENKLPGDRKPLMKEIVELDADNKAGLKGKYEIYFKVAPIEEGLRKTRDYDKALAQLDELLKNDQQLTPKARQQLYLFKANICLRGKHDLERGIKNLQQAAAADPQSKLSQRIPQIIESLRKSQPANQPK
ncbi:MAG: thioredoxin family protein [Deltaproteobacteria bacterium]|nr:thioredoxin family protein [Deltaproteobacteria bacterium]